MEHSQPTQSRQEVPKRPGAYAVSTESKGEPTLFALPVPPGTEPGATFSFRAGERTGLSVRCPTTAKVGCCCVHVVFCQYVLCNAYVSGRIVVPWSPLTEPSPACGTPEPTHFLPNIKIIHNE
jgi:hypothetical protein